MNDSHPYWYIGKDGRPTLARDLEDSRDEWKARAEAMENTLRELLAACKMAKDNMGFSMDFDGWVVDDREYDIGHFFDAVDVAQAWLDKEAG